MSGPLWRDISETLRSRIESGELAPGAQLPTEQDLMEEFGAGRNTVRQALQPLIQRGMVTAQPGRGTFVTEKIDPFVTTLTENPRTGFGGGEGAAYMSEASLQQRLARNGPIKVELQMATPYIARGLGVEPGTPIVSRHQERFIDGRPWSRQSSHYPMTLVEAGAALLLQAVDIDQGPVAYLEDVLGIRQVGYQDLVLGRPAHPDEAAFFRLSGPGSLVFEQRRTAFSIDGRRIRLTVTAYPADRNRFLINEGIVPEDAMSPPPSKERS
ncbi:GntR family transcriptional regulator [Actinocorallia herbida]|uniref:GntR family transcriptional regulator n=1 Tax=Actinocorallia herbida TaxID=58109 RepID=A0A3N1DCY0_9ACTN|nr:GntR family transcriptional regulator [Actinocorallia herbida]ROO90998.1 GntR family transcriptional regulator [Actinocorallia herbida]